MFFRPVRPVEPRDKSSFTTMVTKHIHIPGPIGLHSEGVLFMQDPTLYGFINIIQAVDDSIMFHMRSLYSS